MTRIYLTTHLKTAQALSTQLLLTDLEPAQEGVSKVVIQRQDLGHFDSATVSRLEVHGCAESVTSTTPTPGGWSQWSQWSSCDASCGESGLRVRVRQLVLHTLGVIFILQTRTCTAPAPSHGGAACVGSGEVSDQCYGECTTATTHDCRYVVYPELFANEEPVALATGVSAQYTPGDVNMPSVLLFSFTDSFDVNTVSIQAPGAFFIFVLFTCFFSRLTALHCARQRRIRHAGATLCRCSEQRFCTSDHFGAVSFTC